MTTELHEQERPRNEGRVCDAVIRCIEQRTPESRKAICRPEKKEQGPPVDFRLGVGKQEYAIEHTQIEAFPGQIEADQKYMRLTRTVIAKVSGTLPGPAHYELFLPMDTDLGVKSAELHNIRRDLIKWIRKEAKRLYETNGDRLLRGRKSPRFVDSIEAKPPGFPYSVRLSVRPSCPGPGTLRCSRYHANDDKLKARRAKRLQRALCDKCPKLMRCKDDGARTVLVLESDDLAMTDHVLVGEALASMLAERSDLPDEIYLVETDLNPWWTVRCMKLDTECWPMKNSPEPSEFYVDDLIDLSEAVR